MTLIAFYGFCLATLLAALWVAYTRNLMSAVLGLFCVLVGIAGLFVFSGAEFLAVSQLIVYVGGILILMIFGIMLTRRKMDELPYTGIIQFLPSTLVLMGFLGGMSYVFLSIDWEKSAWMQPVRQPELTNVQFIGKQILTDYVFAFELASILLLLVLIGATYIARNPKSLR